VSAVSSGKPVAKVNGAVLTEQDLMRQMINDFPYAAQHGGRFPKSMEKDIRNRAMGEIVFDELVYQEAQRRKLTVPPAKLQSALRAFKKQFASDAEFKKYLAIEQGGSVEKLREKVRRAILIDRLLTAEVTRKSIVTEAEVRGYYKKHPEHFRRGETITLQTISLVIPDDANQSKKAEIRKRADELLKQAKAAKDYEAFGILAEKSSEDDWHVMMGDHKTIFRGNMPPPVEKVAFSMKPGTVSDLIQTENSWCIVRVNARDESKLLPFEEVRTAIRQDMEIKRKTTAHDQFESRLRKNATIAAL
jgi:peptidyl-prolyl cis-trans isomerase C/foldase protein PrsA